jgi:hypothetical protein
MHGKSFNPADCPPWSEMRNSFGYSVKYSPVPETNHFISSLSAANTEAMRADLEQRNAQRVEQAVTDTWNRLLTPVRAMAESLASPETIFRDTLVTNIRDICALIPSLNLTNSPQLAAAASEINHAFSTINPDTLRENTAIRTDVSARAAALVARFGAIGNRRFAA